ncbi:4Fe-4S dicluster domain-containing protein [Natrialbaceae archaeon AArc-T1-2]|uniref:4Fe-4S dicluster domain-containing protein n=1 Tax=Natrialbaceae archaeon AArc-T1-2 TaxID=3053904 RepID=UPI00255ADAFF|nr:4Fe-4S dicluster domain-containing protein [Natrialbaceae archaeon AArc-T1-2]WIV66482.1 4Fe-4S dicluster domain-containing protein [Natrialbaceae archaeon AArc-T1-2]
MSQMGMAIDLERCQGCRACVLACKTENDTPRGAFWMNVFRHEEGEFPDVEQGFTPNPCHHCSEPSCSEVCPTDARFKREDDGIVLTDYDTCIGCRYCEVGCPYGVNYFQWRDSEEGQYGFASEAELVQDVHQNLEELDADFEGDDRPWADPGLDAVQEPRGNKMGGGDQKVGTMGKCTFCVQRQDGDDDELRGTTACEEVCPTNVIFFGDMEDPESKPRQHLAEHSGKEQWQMLEGTGNEPNVVYLGEQPGSGARNMEDNYKDPEEAIEAEADREPGYLVTDGGEQQ